MRNIVELNNLEVSSVCGGRYKSKTSEKKPTKPQTLSKIYSFAIDLSYDLPWLAMLAGVGISIKNDYSKTAGAYLGIASYSAAWFITRHVRAYIGIDPAVWYKKQVTYTLI